MTKKAAEALYARLPKDDYEESVRLMKAWLGPKWDPWGGMAMLREPAIAALRKVKTP